MGPLFLLITKRRGGEEQDENGMISKEKTFFLRTSSNRADHRSNVPFSPFLSVLPLQT